MKQIKLLLIILLLVACSNDDDEPCSCDINIIVVDGAVGITGEYTITNVPNTCNNEFNNAENFNDFREQENLPDNHWFSTATNCN